VFIEDDDDEVDLHVALLLSDINDRSKGSFMSDIVPATIPRSKNKAKTYILILIFHEVEKFSWK